MENRVSQQDVDILKEYKKVLEEVQELQDNTVISWLYQKENLEKYKAVLEEVKRKA